MDDVLAVHRRFYESIETGDVDAMTSLWVDANDTVCVHPGAEPVYGSSTILRSWIVLMAGVSYLQFFLTDVEVTLLPAGEPAVAIVVCTENILSDGDSVESFNGGRAISTSVLVREGSSWLFRARHASPVVEMEDG